MRSLFAKLLTWFLLALAVSLAGFFLTSAYLAARSADPGGIMASCLQLQLEGAVAAYQGGGQASLASYLERLNKMFPARYALLDAANRDLLTAEDRSAEVALARARPRRPPPPGSPLLIERATSDGRYRLLAAALPRFDPLAYLPYYAWIVVLVALMTAGFAWHLTAPLRQLRQTVSRFGQGDLTQRARSRRRDELGDLAREFDRMADRIETLLTAERRLLQDVSHELRSPLSRLALAVELARTSEDREAALARVKKEAARLSALVAELIEMTRAEGDLSTRQSEPLLLDELIGSVVEDSALEAEAKGCRIECRCDGGLEFSGDRKLLERAVENVLRNAIQHAPEGSAVSVEARRAADWLIVRVRDRGPGIPDEMLEQIFRPFFRVEADRSRESGGVGLGLSIAQRAVRLHGGEIKARNAGPGLEVEIRLPYAGRYGSSQPLTDR